MKRLSILSMIFVFSLLGPGELHAQALIKKIKSKVEDKAVDKAVDKVFGKETPKSDQKQSEQDSDSEKNTSTSKSRKKPTQNNETGGLSKASVDVKENIKSARTAAETKNYPDARYSIQQAIQGIEIEIGQNILKSLPETADGLPKIADEDQVICKGIGFAGLFINRVYGSDDKELSVEIVNDATMLMGINMYLGNPGMGNQSDNNMKQLKYKGYPSVMQFDQSEGYSLNVPFGQTSLFIVKGVNYKNEADFTKAAELFDLEKIKLELGEK
ncbi:MAG: hypothetical protein AB9842_00605 [Bacteroidales bacterium]